MKAFPKRQHFLASSYLIAPYNERPVKFLYKLFTKCFIEDKARLEHFGIRCGRRVQKTLGQVKHFFRRTSTTRLSLPTKCCSRLLFGLVLQVLPNKILLYRLAGCAHWNGPESYSKPTFAAEGKGNPVGVPRLGSRTEQSFTSAPQNT